MADKSLFSRLKRLFSTDVIIRNAGGNQLKVFDVNKAQQTGDLETNALVDRFNRIYSNSGTSIYGQQAAFNYQVMRPLLYSDYDAMDMDAIIASALDIVADESTLKNDMGEVLSILSKSMNANESYFLNAALSNLIDDYDHLFYVSPVGVKMEDNGVRETDIIYRDLETVKY